MLLSSSNPVFVVYAIGCLVLVVHLAFLWNWSGVVRGKIKSTVNPEDAAQYGSTLLAADPPEVARVVRVYENAQYMCSSFFIVALVWVALGGRLLFGEIAIGSFVATRLLYAIVYLRGVQPWRSIFYTASALSVLALIVDSVYLLVRR